MKIIAILILMINFNLICEANSLNNIARGGGTSNTDWDIRVGNGSSNGDWRTLPIIELHGAGRGNGVIGETDTLRNLNNIGDFDLDSISDRWILRTKTRVLSISDIDLIEKYEVKQNEVNLKAFELRSKRQAIPSRFMKRYLEKNVRFNEYILDDFKY